jgi:Putative metallopeptidase
LKKGCWQLKYLSSNTSSFCKPFYLIDGRSQMLNYLKWIGGLALIGLCTVGDLPVASKQVAQAQTTESVSATQIPVKVARYQRSGRMKVVYGETSDRFSAELMEGYRQYRIYESAGKVITSQMQLPRNIAVVLTDCGQANAFYTSEKQAIVICNELTKQNYRTFRKAGYGHDQAFKSAIFATMFTFYHEVGHMLIHELNLPTTGREEDVADQFSAYLLLNIDRSEDKSGTGEIVMSAAQIFKLQSTHPTPGDYIDEHSLNQQRYYNLVCMLYGKAPDRYSGLVSRLNYPESRLNGCRQESEQMFASWQRLLEPYSKEAWGG